MSMPTRTINAIGWHEGRDPNAFFSTAIYLSANPDVKAAGVDPLVHFDQSGWKEGRVPSLDFDPRAVSRGQSGRRGGARRSARAFPRSSARSEGRQPFAPTELIAANGFDYVYYLQHNPDVAAARSIRSSTSRPSAGRKAAIRTRCSTPTAISRPTPTWRPRASIRSTTTPVRLARGPRSVGRLRHDVLSRGLSGRRGRARQSARALPRSSASTRAARRLRTACGVDVRRSSPRSERGPKPGARNPGSRLRGNEREELRSCHAKFSIARASLALAISMPNSPAMREIFCTCSAFERNGLPGNSNRLSSWPTRTCVPINAP